VKLSDREASVTFHEGLRGVKGLRAVKPCFRFPVRGMGSDPISTSVCDEGDDDLWDGNRDAISIESNRLLRLLGKLIASRFRSHRGIGVRPI